MKVKFLKNVIYNGSRYTVGQVAEINGQTAQLIDAGVAEALEASAPSTDTKETKKKK